jgi:hypothetical protein
MAFGFEHGDDFGGRPVAEELAERFLVIRNSVFLDEGDEIGGGVARQGRLGEVRIFGEEVLRLAVEIREIATATAGDQDFLADFLGALEEHDAAATFSCFDGAHESGSAAAQNNHIKVVHPSLFRIGFPARKLLLATRWPRVYTAGT